MGLLWITALPASTATLSRTSGSRCAQSTDGGLLCTGRCAAAGSSARWPHFRRVLYSLFFLFVFFSWEATRRVSSSSAASSRASCQPISQSAVLNSLRSQRRVFLFSYLKKCFQTLFGGTIFV